MHDYLIVSNGPKQLEKSFIEPLLAGRTVIALDGAADILFDMGLLPAVILGDFDSIDKERWGIDAAATMNQSYVGRHGVLLVPALDQNYTDMEKAIMYCDGRGAASIVIANATGDGRMDHSLWNVRVLRKYRSSTRSMLLITPTQVLEYVSDRKFSIHGKIGSVCAILAFPRGRLTTSGLSYDVTDFPLEFAESESIANVMNSEVATIDVTGEALVIYPYDPSLLQINRR